MRLFTFLLLAFATQAGAKQSITLTLASQLDNGHNFYHELIYEALTQQGYQVTINLPSKHIPQKRVVKMVESNQLSLTWLLQTPERDAKYLSIDVPLTNGLIGKRVLLIPPALQPKFDQITTLQALQKSGLVAGMGVDWFDVDVWLSNGLAVYKEDGEWRTLYSRLSVYGEVNYFPRGMNEVGAEAASNPHLAIEQALLLEYDRDFRFYLAPNMAQYRDDIERALKAAQTSGLIDQLIKKHWGEVFDQIKPEQRTVIKLQLPDSTSQKH